MNTLKNASGFVAKAAFPEWL
jgi:hypothetical protein